MGERVVLDTNVFVAAGFNERSNAARIIEAIKDQRWILVWDRPTRGEIRRTIRQIPPLSWEAFSPLFRPEHEYTGETRPEEFQLIEDPDDRKFAALAAATGAILISNDEHLLSKRDELAIQIHSSREMRTP